MIFDIPIIETECLTLRPLTVNDADAAFVWTGDPRVAKYMIYSTHESPEVTREWLSSIPELENEYTWGFVRKSDGKLIGLGSMRFRTDENRWSFGYNVRFDCWNMGYTTEAVKGMMKFIRSEYGNVDFVSECAEENIGSARVMEKCGLELAGKGEYTSWDGTKTFRSLIYESKEG